MEQDQDKYVARTMKLLPDKFLQLCHMHLAFLLDLSGDKLELLLAASTGSEHRKRRLVRASVFRRRDKLPAGCFGLPLSDEGVCLMIPLIKFLTVDKHVSQEGLFRKPGNKSRMAALREQLVAQGPGIRIDAETYTPYDVACVLKEFLRELPEPLLTDSQMEAHRQVLALGQQASSPEEVARYAGRKLSALQLLMLLLPPAAYKLTRHLVQLLQRIADSPGSRMTSDTLGTIFAPIFFIDRKLQASQLCQQISETAPAVSFMIQRAHELFQAPRELVVDLASYWRSLGQQAPSVGDLDLVSSGHHLKKSLSGQTLDTQVCYTDRQLSQCHDVATNTQLELASLLAHIQSLPNTPRNSRLKKQIRKTPLTPVSGGSKRRRSRSISASIRKRLSSLGRLGNAEVGSSLSLSSSSSTETKNSAPPRCITMLPQNSAPLRCNLLKISTDNPSGRNQSVASTSLKQPERRQSQRSNSSKYLERNLSQQSTSSKYPERRQSLRSNSSRCLERDQSQRSNSSRCLERNQSQRSNSSRCLERNQSQRSNSLKCLERNPSQRSVSSRCLERNQSQSLVTSKCQERLQSHCFTSPRVINQCNAENFTSLLPSSSVLVHCDIETEDYSACTQNFDDLSFKENRPPSQMFVSLPSEKECIGLTDRLSPLVFKQLSLIDDKMSPCLQMKGLSPSEKPAGKSPATTPNRRQRMDRKGHSQINRRPATPIMPRAALRLIDDNTPDTSF